MVFWCMMLLFTLMTPAVMIGFGRSFFKKPPRDINATFGYRTTMSMKNQETWKLAHRVCGRYWFICGLILLPLSVLPMLFVINRSTETIGRILIKTEIEKNQNRGNEHNLKLHSIQTQYEEPPEARSNHA